MESEILKFKTEKEWVKVLLSDFEEVLMDRPEEKFVVGLAGGVTPEPFYHALCEGGISPNVIFVTIDERHEDGSNFKMISEALKREDIIHFHTTVGLQESAAKMSEELSRLKSGRKSLFDLVILGMGEDGHIASLFKGSEACCSEELTTVDESRKRVSLAFNALLDTRNAFLLISGQNKLDVVEDLEEEYPVSKFLSRIQTKIYWYV